MMRSMLGSKHVVWSTLGALLLLSGGACSSDQSRSGSPDQPAPPAIDSVESQVNPVSPGESTTLAVVAQREGETSSGVDAGETQTQTNSLSHDATSDADPGSDGTSRRDSGTPGTTEPADTSGGTSGARDASSETSRSSDASSTPDESDDADASDSKPPAPSGQIPEDWTVEWTVEDDDWSISGDGATAELQAPDRYEAETTIEVTVTDDNDQSDSAELSITTGSNTAPAIANTTANPNPVEPAGTIEVDVEASDPNGDALSYEWRIGEPWSVANSEGGEATIAAPDRDGVFADLRVEVSDGYGGSTSSNIRLETRDNQAPVLASLTAVPPQVEPGGTIDVRAVATDANDDELSYTWNVPSGWNASETSGTDIQLTAPDTYDATDVVEVVVEDARGATASGRVVVSTRSNEGPIIASLDAVPQSVEKGGAINLEVTASDPNEDPLSYSWSVADPQNWSLTSQGSGAELEAPAQPGVSTNVEVTVTDEAGATARASAVVSTRSNTPPSLGSVSANPSTLEPGGSGQVTASAADPDGDSLNYAWSASGDWSVSGSGRSVSLQAPDDYNATGVVSVQVMDGFGGQANGEVAVSTSPNQAPQLSALTANPQTLAPSGQTTIEATASDPNGDQLTYSWRLPSGWSKSGSGATIDVTAPGQYGERGLVKVTVTDGQGGQAQGAVLVETDRNQSPVISGVTASPVVLQPGGTTTVTASATDPNGDSLSYSWSVPQSWSQSGSGSEIQVTAPNQTNASATITVEVSDGNGASSTSAVVVQTIQNRPPTIDSLTANPTTVEPNGTTTLKVEASDPEGDALTYNWNVPSRWSQSGSGDEIQLTAPDQYAQSGTVRVMVTDQKAQASEQIVVETVANEAPTIDALTADPNPVLQNSDSTLDVKASDPYGDSLSYQWNVQSNNWSISGSGSTVTLEAPDDGNTSTSVTVTVDDGRGLTTSSSLTVQTKSCPSGQGNCDGDANNGCEVDTTSDNNNCGSCGNPCSGNKACYQSSCRQRVVSVWQCGNHSGQYVFVKNTDNISINSHNDFGRACEHYNYKIPLTTRYSASNRWANRNADYAFTTGCHNCRWVSSHKLPWNSYEPDGSTRPGGTCTYVEGIEIPSGTVVVGAIYNHDATKLACATIKDRMHKNYDWGAGSGDGWYQFYSPSNDPNCTSNRRGSERALNFNGVPDWLMCAR